MDFKKFFGNFGQTPICQMVVRGFYEILYLQKLFFETFSTILTDKFICTQQAHFWLLGDFTTKIGVKTAY